MFLFKIYHDTDEIKDSNSNSIMLRKRGLLYASDVNKFINHFPGLEYVGTYIRCTFCNLNFAPHGIQTCRRHIKSKRHIANATHQVPYWKFLHDFTFMLSVCNIPQHIVDNDNFRLFWKKLVPSRTLPTKKQLRNNFPRVKTIIEDSIRCDLKNNKIWLSVNKATNAKKNCVLNILVRVLKSDKSSVPYLLSSKRLQNTNTEAIVENIESAVEKFEIQRDLIVMLVTDGSSTMLKAGKLLKNYLPNIFHVTCLLHAFHAVDENIRNCYPKVDRLITCTRKIFVKSPKRIRGFKMVCPDIALPPLPALMRWGTWLEAVQYYNKHFDKIKTFVLKLDLHESQAIEASQQLFLNVEVEIDIREISEKYSVIIKDISNLQNGKLSLAESLDIVHHFNVALDNMRDTVGLLAAEKFHSILDKNPDFQKILYLNQCLSENEDCDVVSEFKYANITSLDVERSFSKYSKTFSPFRTCLSESTMEALQMLRLYASTLNRTTLMPE